MNEQIEKMQELLDAAKVESEKFYVKGVKASATRLRTNLQEIKKLCQEIRVDVQEKKSAMA